MSWPTTSDGMRSGVNCSRLKSRSRAADKVLTRSVLATPGTPSRSTCPLTSRATTSAVTTRSWPTTALATSSRTRRTAWRGSFLVGTDHLPAQRLGLLGQLDQSPLARRRGAAEQGPHLVRRTTDALGGRVRHLVGGRTRRQPQTLRQRAPYAVPHHGRSPVPPVGPLQEATDGGDELGARHLDRRRLGHRTPQPAGPPQGEED